MEGYINDLRECSHGYLNYDIVEETTVDKFPRKADGFTYTAESYMKAWGARKGFHDPDWVDYDALIEEFDMIPAQRLAQGLVAGAGNTRRVGDDGYAPPDRLRVAAGRLIHDFLPKYIFSLLEQVAEPIQEPAVVFFSHPYSPDILP